MNTATAPVIEYVALMPILILLGAACIGILVEAFLPRHHRFHTQLVIVGAAIVGAFIRLIANWRQGRSGIMAMGSLTLDGPTYVMWSGLLVFGLLAVLVFAERKANGGVTTFAASAATTPGSKAEATASAARIEHTEIFPLFLFSLAGMMLFLAANDMLTLFVALEVFSLPLYLMCGMARRRRLLSQEAALKYFLLGAFSSAFFLFGVALVYGYTGSFTFGDIAIAVTLPTQGRGLLITGLALMVVGVLFKIGAVPFHNWTPDVYVGAPTPVTGFMAICTKAAASMALLRLLYTAFGGERWSWQPVLMVIAILTMLLGAVFGLTQTDVKRLLAYSSVAHAGFILTAVVGAQGIVATGQLTSVGAVMFYLIAYGFATIGAFAIVTLVRRSGGETNAMDDWAGLGRRSPVLAGIFSFFLLSFAGIPLTAGFIGKWAAFESAWRGGYKWLVVVAVIASLIAAFFYLKLIMIMWFQPPAEGVEVAVPSALTWVPIIVGALATLLLGVAPGLLLDVVSTADVFLR
ncbi:MAG: NADH-quinone oxidoreductase subunit NuoN [Micropruina sp.]|nr:NADH-quinone oxidoreductase subunit NuoN [Micropruina sp.]